MFQNNIIKAPNTRDPDNPYAMVPVERKFKVRIHRFFKVTPEIRPRVLYNIRDPPQALSNARELTQSQSSARDRPQALFNAWDPPQALSYTCKTRRWSGSELFAWNKYEKYQDYKALIFLWKAYRFGVRICKLLHKIFSVRSFKFRDLWRGFFFVEKGFFINNHDNLRKTLFSRKVFAVLRNSCRPSKCFAWYFYHKKIKPINVYVGFLFL